MTTASSRAEAPTTSADEPGGMRRLFHGVLAFYSWLALALVVLLGVSLQVVVLALTWPFDRQRRIAGRLIRLTGVTISKAVPFWSFSAHKPLPEYRPRKTVCISNHLSQTDTFLISYLPWEMKWLAKASTFKIPFMGWAVWLAGDIGIVRGNPGSARRAMDRCRKYLERNMPIMIFPEGTRSRDGNLLPFKDGAFRLAIETGAELLPLAVWGSQTALPKGSWKPGFATAKVAMGSPISTAGMTLDDVERLKAESRKQVEELQATLKKSIEA